MASGARLWHGGWHMVRTSQLWKRVMSNVLSVLFFCRGPVLRVSGKLLPERPLHPLPFRRRLHRHPPGPGRLLWEQRLRVQLRQRGHNQRHWEDRLLYLPNQHLPRGALAPAPLHRELLPRVVSPSVRSACRQYLPQKLLCLSPVHTVTFLT